MSSKSFGAQQDVIAHLTEGKQGIPGELWDLRLDVEQGFKNNEARLGFPELDWLDGAEPADTATAVVLRGRKLNQGQTFDTLTLAAGAAAGAGKLIITTMKPGDSGIKVKILAAAGAGATLAYSEYDSVALTSGSAVIDLVAVAPGESNLQAQILDPQGTLAVSYNPIGKMITIQPAAAGSTAGDIVSALAANATIAALVTASVGNAATTTVAVAATPLAGGRVLVIAPPSGGSTASTIATAINATASQCKGVLWATVSGDATPFTVAVAATPLAGGTGLYDSTVVTFSGVAGALNGPSGVTGAAVWTDTMITVVSPDLTAASVPRLTGDKINVVIESNGVRTNPITVQLGGGTAGATGVTGVTGQTGPDGPKGVTGVTGQTGAGAT
jgi:hypothetical protein